MVVGAGGAIGEATAHALRQNGFGVRSAMRRSYPNAVKRLACAGAEIVTLDLEEPEALEALASGCDGLVFCNRLELTVRAIAGLALTGRRLIAFSSNNVAVHAESETYAGIAEAEAQLRQRFPNVIIVRPTLIYGDPRLPTLPRLMSIARTWPIMPLPGTGRANLQPVFHEDLAYVVAGLMKEDTQGGVYAVGGPEVLTMRELFDAVQVAVGVRRPVISIRGAPLEFMARMRLFGFSPEQAARADRNRTAVPQAPLPPALCPRTRMQDGLARLAVALGYRE